jgi:hypothetical protein
MLGVLVGVLISALTAAVVGARLLRLARHTRQLPELSAGIGLVAFALAQAIAILSSALASHLPPGALLALRGCYLSAFSLVSIGLIVFTVETFGRTAWRCTLGASIVVTGIAVRVAIFLADVPMNGTPAHGASPSLAQLVAGLTYALTYGWMGAEALHYHGKARRAYRIGLASPEVVSRFWVLGVGALSAATISVAAATVGSLGHPVTIFLVSGALVNAVTLVLVFMPPAAYRSFVDARAAEKAAARG